MSKTLLELVAATRVHLKDLSPADYVFSSDFIKAKLDNAARNVVAPKLRLGQTYNATALAIDPSSEIYTLPGTTEYAEIRQVRLDSLGREVQIKSIDFLRSLWSGIMDRSRVTGDPFYCAIWEDTDQKAKLMLYPWPRRADALGLFSSVMPAQLVNDTDVLPFDESACTASEYQAAGEILATASDRQLTALDQNANAGATFLQLAQGCIADSVLRHDRMRGVGSTGRYRR